MIRPAQPNDALQAAPLLCAAWGHLIPALTGTEDISVVQDRVATFFAQSANRLSYENALVAEQDGRVAGVLVCYWGGDAAALDAPLTAQLIARTGDPAASVTVEAEPDEFYLDTLSVHPDFQRQGIGAALLQAFETRAAERGYSRLGLLVEPENTGAKRLYAKVGYVTDGTRRLAGVSYEHMEKRR